MKAILMAGTILASTWTTNLEAEDRPNRKNSGPPQTTDCPDESQLRQWFSPIDKVKADITRDTTGGVPPDRSHQLFSSAADDPAVRTRKWAGIDFTWEPTNFCSWPLYFEDVQLERYGQTVVPLLQPLVSATEFLGTFPLLPIKMAVDPPRHCVYALGYYRPGKWMPRQCPHCQGFHAPPSPYRKDQHAPPILEGGAVSSR